jgi:helix-turn-helix protein
MQKFRDVLSRWDRGELSMMEAGELLGMSERQFRRYRDRYEEDGVAGLSDGRQTRWRLDWSKATTGRAAISPASPRSGWLESQTAAGWSAGILIAFSRAISPLTCRLRSDDRCPET